MRKSEWVSACGVKDRERENSKRTAARRRKCIIENWPVSKNKIFVLLSEVLLFDYKTETCARAHRSFVFYLDVRVRGHSRFLRRRCDFVDLHLLFLIERERERDTAAFVWRNFRAQQHRDNENLHFLIFRVSVFFFLFASRTQELSCEGDKDFSFLQTAALLLLRARREQKEREREKERKRESTATVKRDDDVLRGFSSPGFCFGE